MNEAAMRIVTSLFVFAAIWTCCALPAGAAEVYRWVGADGVVHYSDEKPRDESAFTTIEVADTRTRDYDPLTDPYSILNQAKRMGESWSALAGARADRIEERRRTSPDPLETDRLEYRQPLEFGARYFSPWLYSTPAPLYGPRRVDPGAAQRQLRALEGLELSGQRPASINSGVHRERVQRSESLPVTSPRRPD